MSETEELQAEVERLRAHHTKMTRYDEGLVKSERRRAEAAEAEVERLKQGLYPLTQWTIEQATQLADRIGTSEGSLFVAWINERKRADAAEAQVERLTRECLDREATETDARERLRQAETKLASLGEAVKDVCWKVTPYGKTEDGDIAAYIAPKGTIHRLIGAAQSAGIPAAFRAALANTEVGEPS